ncbi:MAG: hypothetical protein AAF636_26725, partial [Pseudomonadota bacterium]
SFTTRSAGALEFARFDLIFVPYSHYDETKTLRYPTTSICLMNADGEQGHYRVRRGYRRALGLLLDRQERKRGAEHSWHDHNEEKAQEAFSRVFVRLLRS